MLHGAAARAGAYHVYSCRTPAGQVAPADGWTPVKAGSETVTLNSCEAGGALVAGLKQASRTANVASATWGFTVPAGTTLAGATLWRAGDAAGGAGGGVFYQLWLAGPVNSPGPETAFGQCIGGSSCPTGLGSSEPLASANEVEVPHAHLGAHLYLNAGCLGKPEFECPEGQHDANGYAAVVYLYAADLLLEQNAGPSASGVSGELASAPTVAGTSDVAFSAGDAGSGVYAAVFSVDGQVVQRSVLDEQGGRCRDVGQSPDGLPAFLYVQPCPASISADVGFDTTRVANGPHHLVVSVIDAGGNSAPVLDRVVTIANALAPGTGPPNGVNASPRATLTVAWQGSAAERVTRPFGRGATIRGRLLTSTGTPIAGAHIDLTATPAFQGATPAAISVPLTGPDGRFFVTLSRRASSATLRFGYRPHLDSEPPVATRTLTLRVRAGVRLVVSPHTSSVGHAIHFTGRLAAGPIPRGGKLLVLEARSPGGEWLQFHTVHSDRHGRFRAGYRFRFPGPAFYQFRAVAEAEADYPFAGGASNVVGVSEH